MLPPPGGTKLLDEGENLVHGQTNLLHGITEADGYAAIFLALEVVGDAERSTDLIFTAVPLTNGTGLIVVHHEVVSQLGPQFPGRLGQLLGQRQYSSLIRSQSRMQTQYGADIALAYFLLVIGIAQEGQSHTVSTQ